MIKSFLAYIYWILRCRIWLQAMDLEKRKLIDVEMHIDFMRMKTLKNLRNLRSQKCVACLTPIFSSSDNATDREVVQVEHDDDKPIVVNGEDAIDTKGDEHGWQPTPPKIKEYLVRRSTREHCPSTKYSPF